MKMTELRVAQELGEQVYNNKPLTCPNCTQWCGPLDEKQPMSSVGDMREVLFCPHCDLTVELKVTFR
jgi:hypothetical protein